MKKFLFVMNVSVLLLAGLFILVGCPSGGSSEVKEEPVPEPEPGRGVLGQISGLVYNPVTVKPIQGVSVVLGTRDAVQTDANGAFLIADVEPGTYTVSFIKDGFQFRTKNVYVDPRAYIDDDPWLEVESFEAQLGALLPFVLGSSDFTYNNGVYINGDGTAVTVEKGEDGQFKVEQIKLDYTYNKSVPLYITSLAPLTGAIKVSVNLFNKPFSTYLNEKIDSSTAIGDGVEFWFRDPAFVNDPDDIIGWGLGDSDNGIQPVYPDTPPDGFQEAKGGGIYGPVKTQNGDLSFTGLPVGVPLVLVSNGFTNGNLFYKFNSTPYIFNETATDPTLGSRFTSANGVAPAYAATIFTPTNNANTDSVSNVGKIYLFPAGNFATVNNYDTGTPAAPKAINGSISLTFSEAIDQANFTASLGIPANVAWANGATVTVGNITLAGTWDADSKTVTLAPDRPSAQTGGVNAWFPYSQNASTPIGRLTITGKAQSGATILVANGTGNPGGIPVYTQEAIKLVSVDVNPTGIPPRAVVSADAIKLTFSKAISGINTPNAPRFWLGNQSYDNGKPVQFNIDATGTVVFVYTNLLTTSTSQMYYSVYSAADPTDSRLNQQVNADGFQKPSVTRLTLNSTNIYNGVTPVTDYQASNVRFPVNGALTLTFDGNIPFTTADDISNYVIVSLSTNVNGVNIPLTKTVSSKTLTITPTVPLLKGTVYYLNVRIAKGNDTYFNASNDIVSGTIAVINNNNIIFMTQAIKRMALTSTNIYNGVTPVTAINTSNVRFPVNGALTLTFDSDIPFTTAADIKDYVLVALSRNVTSATVNTSANSISLSKTVSGKTLTITPTVPLLINTQYYLDVQFVKLGDTYFKASEDIVSGINTVLSSGNIIFMTVEGPASTTVSARAPGPTSATSAALTITGGNITSGTNLRTGTPYYVQFDGNLNFTSPPSTAPIETSGLRLTVNNNFTNQLAITFELIAPDILKFTITTTATAPTANTIWNQVALRYNIGGTTYLVDVDEDGTPGNDDNDDADPTTPDPQQPVRTGSINTTSGTFSIGGLTVRNYD